MFAISDEHGYSEFVPRPPLQPGTHGRISVAPTSEALRARGEFVAHARVRPHDGSEVRLVRRFGSTETGALASLRSVLTDLVGAVEESAIITDAERRILTARAGFGRFVAVYDSTLPHLQGGTEASEDFRRSTSPLVPMLLTEGFAATIVDHLRTWGISTAPQGDDPRPSLGFASDFTLFRAVLESLAAAIWMLGPAERETRILRATRLAIYEHSKSTPLKRMDGSIDAREQRLFDEQRADIEQVCAAMNYDFDALSSRTKVLGPTEFVRGARDFIPGAADEFFYYWTVCSRYSHAQMQSARAWSVESEQWTADGSTALFEVDPSLVADIADFITTALDQLVALLRERGVVRVPRSAH